MKLSDSRYFSCSPHPTPSVSSVLRRDLLVFVNKPVTSLVLQVLEAVTPQTHVIFLCSPNNPTGNILATDSIIALLEEYRGIVVIDEAYVDFCSSGSLCYLLDKYPRLVILQTFSKAFGLAGARWESGSRKHCILMASVLMYQSKLVVDD